MQGHRFFQNLLSLGAAFLLCSQVMAYSFSRESATGRHSDKTKATMMPGFLKLHLTGRGAVANSTLASFQVDSEKLTDGCFNGLEAPTTSYIASLASNVPQYNLTNAVLESIAQSNASYLASLVNPDTCQLRLLTENESAGVDQGSLEELPQFMRWWYSATLGVEAELERSGISSDPGPTTMEHVWQLLVKAPMETMTLEDCQDPGKVQAFATYLSRAPQKPLTLQYSRRYKPYDPGFPAIIVNAAILQVAPLQDGQDAKSIRLLVLEGSIQAAFETTLEEICQAGRMVAIGPACTETVLENGESVDACFGGDSSN